MYCSNCGKKVGDEKAIVCVGCGCAIVNNNKVKAISVRGMASLVIAMFGVVFAIFNLFALPDIGEKLDFASSSYQIGFAIGFVMIQSAFAIIAIILAASERRQNKNELNKGGLCVGLTTVALSLMQFMYVILY